MFTCGPGGVLVITLRLVCRFAFSMPTCAPSDLLSAEKTACKLDRECKGAARGPQGRPAGPPARGERGRTFRAGRRDETDDIEGVSSECACLLRMRANGGGRTHLLPGHLALDHASLSRKDIFPTPSRGTSNIWALATFFSVHYINTFCVPCPSLPVSPPPAGHHFVGGRLTPLEL